MYYSREMLSNAKWMNYFPSPDWQRDRTSPRPACWRPRSAWRRGWAPPRRRRCSSRSSECLFIYKVLCHAIQIVILLWCLWCFVQYESTVENWRESLLSIYVIFGKSKKLVAEYCLRKATSVIIFVTEFKWRCTFFAPCHKQQVEESSELYNCQ